MKKSLTNLEKKAEELWVTFDHQKPAIFWKKYEALRTKSLTQKQTNIQLNDSTNQNPGLQPTTLKKVFHPHLFSIFLRVVGILTCILIIVIPLAKNASSMPSMLLGCTSFLALVGIIFLWCIVFSDTHSFEINNQHLVIKNKFISSQKSILWKRIQTIELEPNLYSSEADYPLDYDILIKLDTGFQYRNSYKLSTQTHLAFFSELHKQGIHLIDRNYNG